MPKARLSFWIGVALFLLTVGLYGPVSHFDFVNFDDPDYVVNNPHLRTWAEGIPWALTSGEAANWFPLTRLSHLLDYQLFGLDSGWHHLSSVLLHALAVVLLFVFLQRATGQTAALWPGAFVALLFAVHPLHVESVAWVAERKDVLCAVFWFLTLYCYVRFVRTPGSKWYGLALLSFALGLMAKPMIVTLPFLLLLLDVWPLRRAPFSRSSLLEKLPFLALAGVAALVTFLVQQASGAVQDGGRFPFSLRVANALVSYGVYLGDTLWPAKLAVYYPHPASIPVWQWSSAAVGLAVVSVVVWQTRRVYPYLLVGWLWFLGTLVPVIGLVQVGAQARADRYMYVPMVGLGIMLAFGAADVIRRWPVLRLPLAVVAALAGTVWAGLTWAQEQTWQNSGTLFTHALAVTERSYVAEHNLGSYLVTVPGQLSAAILHLEAALRIEPDSAKAHTDLANALAQVPGRTPQAMREYREALRLEPNDAIPHNNLGNALAQEPGRLPDAIAEYEIALRLNPSYAEAHNNLGSALANAGRAAEAKQQFEAALQLRPGYPEAQANLLRLQAPVQAAPQPTAEFHNNAGLALSKAQRLPEAVAEFQAALQLNPNNSEAHNNLGAALVQMPGRQREALAQFAASVRLDPENVDAHYNLGVALSEVPGRTADAIKEFEAVQKRRPDPDIARILAQLRATL